MSSPAHALAATRPALEWQRGTSAWYIASGCGRYTVSKTVGPQSIVYHAWHGQTTRATSPKWLGMAANARDAQQLCAAHFEAAS